MMNAQLIMTTPLNKLVLVPSKEELEERRKRIDFAKGSVALEGMAPTNDDDIEQRYLAGEIDGDDYVRLVLERIESEKN